MADRECKTLAIKPKISLSKPKLASASYLEVCVGEHVGGGVKVLELLEGGHDLGPGDAALLVDELDGRALPVVRHAVPHLSGVALVPGVHRYYHLYFGIKSIAHHHVELVLVVLDAQHHRHRLADLDDASHLVGVRALAHLDSGWLFSGVVRPHHGDSFTLENYSAV